MPSCIFHLVAALFTLILALFCSHAGAALPALAFLIFAVVLVGIGLYELQHE